MSAASVTVAGPLVAGTRLRHTRPRLTSRTRLALARRPLKIAALIGLALWLTLGGGIPTLVAAGATLAAQSSAQLGYRVGEIAFEGRINANEAVLQFLLQAHVGEPIFDVDLGAVRSTIEDNYPWIRRATVRRVLPQRLVITLEERIPVALWQQNGQLSLVDSDGLPISDDPGEIERFPALPHVIGAEAIPESDKPKAAAMSNDLAVDPSDPAAARAGLRLPSTAGAFLPILTRHTALYRQVRAARWTAGRRWSLVLHNGIVIELPEGDLAAAMDLLERLAAETDLLMRDITAIDLRKPGVLVVRTPTPLVGGEAGLGRTGATRTPI